MVKDGAHAEFQLWLLTLVHVLQLAFLVLQMPFNDRFENIVQACVPDALSMLGALIIADASSMLFLVLCLVAIHICIP